MSVMQANPWMHFQFLKSLEIAFCYVAEVLPRVMLIQRQERELKFPLPCHLGIAEHPYGKGANSSKTAYDCVHFMFSFSFNNKRHSFR